MTTIVLASDNNGKIVEFNALFANLSIELISQKTLDIKGAEETGDSFAENAHIKALHAAKESGYPALSDDSGLSVDALGGQPGIYSARYAGMAHLPNAERDQANLNKLLNALQGVPKPQRTAHFYCALAIVWPDQMQPLYSNKVFTGQWHGRILESPSGQYGFGYDPVFFVEEEQCSAADLHPDKKHRISHRALAWKQMLRYIKDCKL